MLSGIIQWLFLILCFAHCEEVGDWRHGQIHLRQIRGNVQTHKYSTFHLIISTPESTSYDSRVLSSHAEVASNIHQILWFYRGMSQKMDLFYKQIHLLGEIMVLRKKIKSQSATRVKPFKIIINLCIS